jgi:hypothetical protein
VTFDRLAERARSGFASAAFDNEYNEYNRPFVSREYKSG